MVLSGIGLIMRKLIELNLDQDKQLNLLGKALSVKTRLDILRILMKEPMNINEIGSALHIPASSCAAHVKVLEEAGLIKTSLQPGIRGSMKLCEVVIDNINIDFQTDGRVNENVEVINMPIGNYVDYKVAPTCGLVSEKGPIDEEDEPRCFYNPSRTDAKMLWVGRGYVEYRFPNNCILNKKVSKLELSCEICSEDHEYNLDCPSDLTVWVNGNEVGTFTCPSDFGGRRGKLNPDWWPDKNTQYGLLKTWSIDCNGSYIDGVETKKSAIHSYKLNENDYISVRIGMKDDAVNMGGMNLFGDCFGDYAQNIVMKLYFS
ncbi:transcriptional regulator, ArsR family [Lachnospiraceae bacterium KM106-2]|nr:transcriptional regulator, ArsR family [Lachnospiraceae bacterium KM106-2]